jgi:ABC-2 type transport system ATP-binding protein
MSQRFSLYEKLTVDQNIAFFGGIYGLDPDRLAAAAASCWTWPVLRGREATLTGELSAGWRQRLALGCAILHEPPIVFLDEPTGGVDPLSAPSVLAAHRRSVSRRRGRPRHDALSRRSRALPSHRDHPGRPACRARHCEELKAIFASDPFSKSAPPRQVAAMRALDAMPRVEKTSIFGTAVHAVLRSNETLRRRSPPRLESAGIHPLSCSVVEPSLEDVFLDVAERTAA